MSDDPALPFEAEGAGLKPRDHHYLFAHRVLPGLVFAEPSRFAQILIGGHGEAFLMDLWDMIPDQYGLDLRLPREGLAYSVALAEDATGMITVRLPPPKAVTEAHFVTVVFGASQEGPRYFTLELGYSIDERPRTVLGEWSKGGELHANFGDGPLPEEGAFREAVSRLIARG